MKVVVGSRQTGKTFFLVRKSERTGHPIVCVSQNRANYISRMAEEIGCKIPNPIVFSHSGLNLRGIKTKVLVDDAEKYIKTFFSDFGIEISFASVNSDYILD